MRVSVVVPTYNRLSQLQACVASLQALVFDAFEVVIVDDGSTDGTAEWLDALGDARFRIVHQANSGQSAARNAGITAATGDCIAFTDDDCTVDPHWLSALVARLDDARADFAFGPTIYVKPGYRGYFPERLTGNGNGQWPGAANLMVRREALQRVGAFDSTFDAYHNEDTELAIRLVSRGYRFVRVPDAHVYHQPATWSTQSLRASAKNLSVWPILKRKYPRHYHVFDGPVTFGFLADPADYLKILTLPVLLPVLLARYWLHGKRDLRMFFAKWPVWILRRRWLLYREMARQKVFLV